eukprot:FR743764.1.p3 GENE.FR743764.1~~FR743764.1.p3  ORF type:complete len:109 (+),score=15.12 FR743764.1:761-1087(+)
MTPSLIGSVTLNTNAPTQTNLQSKPPLQSKSQHMPAPLEHLWDPTWGRKRAVKNAIPNSSPSNNPSKTHRGCGRFCFLSPQPLMVKPLSPKKWSPQLTTPCLTANGAP